MTKPVPDAPRLTTAQREALDHVTQLARRHTEGARRRIEEVLRMSDIAIDTFERAVEGIKAHARVAVHFHPDRPDSRGRRVVDALNADGLYKSQYETGISNGGLTAHPGGERHSWESRLFGGAYDKKDAAPSERPKYGALDLMRYADGPSPRFGSCYLLLEADVSSRCTFGYLDSHAESGRIGTYEAFDDVVGALLWDAFVSDFAIGERDLTPPRLIDHLATGLREPLADPPMSAVSRNLNHYVEAHVHGDVLLAKDAAVLVADPSFSGTDIGASLERLCDRFDIRLAWHPGFEMDKGDVPTNFRGPTMPSLAARVARDGRVNAHAIGLAVDTAVRNPDAWRDRGTPADVLQELKLLWHVLVRTGGPHRSRSD